VGRLPARRGASACVALVIGEEFTGARLYQVSFNLKPGLICGSIFSNFAYLVQGIVSYKLTIPIRWITDSSYVV
jgi:hypothetical protein